MSPHLKLLHMTRKFSTDNVRGVRDKYQVCSFPMVTVQPQAQAVVFLICKSISFVLFSSTGQSGCLPYLQINICTGFQAQAQAVAGPGFGAFADASLCRIEGGLNLMLSTLQLSDWRLRWKPCRSPLWSKRQHWHWGEEWKRGSSSVRLWRQGKSYILKFQKKYL